MATTSELNRVSMVVLRYMRRPIIVLILVYAVGISGMALIPGVDADGRPEYMSLFHAFYFFTYTATTTGFGEIPNAFTDTQRLWTICCLYMGVVAWLYAITSIIQLVQNPHFVQAINENRFASVVKRISEPFFIICGFGDTGSLLARGLSDNGLGGVIITKDPERIKALGLRNYRIKMPGLFGDPSAPKHLLDAGVQHDQCKAVIALTNDEDANVKIAVVSRFMNPNVHIICRSTSPKHQEQLAALQNVTIINPFEIFAQLLSMAITHPRLHNLNRWLIGDPGVTLDQPLSVPREHWILCGYGRMGRWIHKHMTQNGIQPFVIDPDIDESSGIQHYIRGYADHETLSKAGLARAAGVVAGTNNDSHNLNILMSTQVLQPDAFTIVRQNQHENQLAFDAAKANLILQPSLIIGRSILKQLISLQIEQLIDYLQGQEEDQTVGLCDRLREVVGDQMPHLWCVSLTSEQAPAAIDFMNVKKSLTLTDVIRHPSERDEFLNCVPLVIDRDSVPLMLPANDERLYMNDKLLFCGTKKSERLLTATLNNAYTLHYLHTGEEMPRGYVFSWFKQIAQKSKGSNT